MTATAGVAASCINSRQITALIGYAAANAPRSLQEAIGPSEAGEPCTRRLAYKMAHIKPVPARRDVPWAAIQGTATHAWLADVFRTQNALLGQERYLIEQRVTPATPDDIRTMSLPSDLAGSCDLFDRETGAVMDWKLTSPDRLKRYVSRGPGQVYRIQGHLYGRGMANAGEDVRTVAVVFLPRAASLNGMHVWSEPYKPEIAEQALTRLAGIRDALFALEPEKNPGRWDLFPASPETCRYCPWFKAGSRYLAAGCPGHPDADVVTAAPESLIA